MIFHRVISKKHSYTLNASLYTLTNSVLSFVLFLQLQHLSSYLQFYPLHCILIEIFIVIKFYFLLVIWFQISECISSIKWYFWLEIQCCCEICYWCHFQIGDCFRKYRMLRSVVWLTWLNYLFKKYTLRDLFLPQPLFIQNVSLIVTSILHN